MGKDKYTWNLSDLYKSDKDSKIEEDIRKVEKKNYEFINKWKDRKDYLKDPRILRKALDEYNELEEKYGVSGIPGYYFSLRNYQDETDKDIIKRLKQLQKQELKIINDIQFFDINISKIPKDKQKNFLNSKYLQPYKHFLERIFAFSEHILSEKEEKILNLTSSPSYSNWVDMTSQFLSKETIEIFSEEGKKITVPFSMARKYEKSKIRRTRKSASKEELNVLDKLSDTAEHEINSILESKRVSDELRGYKKADESRHLSDDISNKTVETMLNTVENNFSVCERYYKLKARLHNKKKLTYFERYLPYGDIEKEYTYEEALNIVKRVFGKLDPEFRKIIEDLQNKGRYDIFPKKGKGAGAFCTSHIKSLPVYILLNFESNLDSVLTIAHETGHAVNSILTFKEQNALNCSTPLSIAEVSSTFFEDFTLKEIIKISDDETKLAILMKKLNEDISAIHRQVACYRFEQELHKEFRKESFLSKEKISEIFKKYMQAYMGKYVIQDKGSEYFWVEWSHIRNFFYVYSYANGLLISKALQNMVKRNPKDIKKVKTMLSNGTFKSPEDMFKGIGIDISKKEFWEKGLKEIESTYNEAYKLAEKLRKI